MAFGQSVVDARQRKAVAVDDDQRRIARARAKAVNCRRIGAGRIRGTERTLAGATKADHGRHRFQDLLDGLHASLLDRLAPNADQI